MSRLAATLLALGVLLGLGTAGPAWADTYSGEFSCAPGYVWRQAVPNNYQGGTDFTCVTTATRSQAAADNATAASRWVDGAYGPHTCSSGYVWREAVAGDQVCVTTATRSQAAADNAAAASRFDPPTDYHCTYIGASGDTLCLRMNNNWPLSWSGITFEYRNNHGSPVYSLVASWSFSNSTEWGYWTQGSVGANGSWSAGIGAPAGIPVGTCATVSLSGYSAIDPNGASLSASMTVCRWV